MDAPSSLWITADGVLVHNVVWGSAGPEVILVPGITSPAATWGFVARRLSRFARVYVMDVRGRGLSDHNPDLSYGERDCALDVVALGRRLKRPFLLGHSMGARIAVAAAAGRDLFAGLIAADPPVSGPGRRPYPTPLNWYLDAIREVGNAGGLEAARRAVPTWSQEQAALRATWLPTCSPVAVAQGYDSFHTTSVHELLPEVRCPTLLLYAERGDVIRDGEAAELVDLLPNGRSKRIEGAGHMIPWDQLDAFVDEVEAFVAAHQ